MTAHDVALIDDRNAEIAKLKAENADLRRTVSQLSGEVGTLRVQVSALRAEREKMRVRLFDFAWEMARSQKPQ